jgi:predicted PurR-regulated permease PerM
MARNGREQQVERPADPPPTPLALEVPWRTILRILFAAALVWAFLHLLDLITVVVVAVILAVTLHPIVTAGERRGVRRGVGALLIAAVVFAALGAAIAFVVPAFDAQVQTLGTRLGTAVDALRSKLPAPFDALLGTSAGSSPPVAQVAQHVVSFGQRLMADVVMAVFAFVLSLYLLVEGRRTYRWLLAYVPCRNRARADLTACEAQRLVTAYVVGNLITSLFAAVFAYAVLAFLHVPAAFVLALLAGVLDLIPVLGFLAFVVTAVIVAASVSATAALVVLAAYSAYHAFENYYLVPRVYGQQLRLSMLAVLLAFSVGAELWGVVGALIALPIAAAYPAVERIWLREYLAAETVEDHTRLEAKQA